MLDDSPSFSLPLCEVLEREFTELTGQAPDPPPVSEFTAEQILDPERLATRFANWRHTSEATWTAEQARLTRLFSGLLAAHDATALRTLLRAELNGILLEAGFYDPKDEDRFREIHFRSQTADRLAAGPVRERNRLLLEDAFPELQKVYDLRLAAIYRRVHAQRPAALCLSGGGIRSATFGLGVIQGLARNGLLDRFQYLSTVSGGGYIGGWLSAWIRHTSLAEVVRRLKESSGKPLEPEPAPVWHLRNYSNYLSPRLGLLSADTWTLLATYLRNLVLNWLVLVPLLAGALMLPRLLVAVVSWQPDYGQEQWLFGWGAGFAVLALVCSILVVAYVHRNRPWSRDKVEGASLRDNRHDQRAFLRRCLTPMLIGALAFVVCWAWSTTWGGHWPLSLSPRWTFALVGMVVHLIGWLFSLGDGRDHRAADVAKEALAVALTGAAAGFVGLIVLSLLPAPATPADLHSALYVSFSGPALLSVALLFSQIYIGYTSDRQVDAEREWAARYNAWILMLILVWLVGTSLVLLGPVGLHWGLAYLAAHSQTALHIAQAILGALGLGSGAVTLGVGFGGGTGAKDPATSPRTGLALALAAPVFAALLLIGLSWLGAATIHTFGTRLVPWLGALIAASASGSSFFHFQLARLAAWLLQPAQGCVDTMAFPLETCAPVWTTMGAMGALLGFGLWSSRHIDSNEFSLHAMYRARLIRAYLGASRPAGSRAPNPFTGFDDRDNFPIAELWTPGAAARGAPRRPLHIVNVALNLVSGGNLAWQQRKAESFTFSPLHCGAANVGYRETSPAPSGTRAPQCYAGVRGVSLGTAITISGAAASPNMGYHSSPTIAFLLTLFNVRLGWWLGNPGHAGRKVFDRPSPATAVGPILDEALGHTDDRNEYVYLSDGGHFENLGLYEMVLRRCHTIVVSDAGCDPQGSFEDLGNAIRKIRIDLGISIDLDTAMLRAREGLGAAPAGKYCAIGTIWYSDVDWGAKPGRLIYLKPAFYGGEPRDVYNYARTSESFPHESTADQYFSEAQFESYRALGEHVIAQILPPRDELPAETNLEWFLGKIGAYVSVPLR